MSHKHRLQLRNERPEQTLHAIVGIATHLCMPLSKKQQVLSLEMRSDKLEENTHTHIHTYNLSNTRVETDTLRQACMLKLQMVN